VSLRMEKVMGLGTIHSLEKRCVPKKNGVGEKMFPRDKVGLTSKWG